MHQHFGYDAAMQLRAIAVAVGTVAGITARVPSVPRRQRGAALAGVSVVIPTFRRLGPLQEAIESALRQEGVDVEVIVVDDSPEASARDAVLAFADDRVRYAQPETPSGGRPGIPRNAGAALATKEFVHFLDDDDRLADGALAALTTALAERSGVGVAMGIVSPFGDDPEALAHEQAYFSAGAVTLSRMRSRLELTRNMLFARTPLVNSSCMVRRSCIPHIGGYSPIVKYVEDVDFYLRAVRRFGFVFVNRPVVHYRTGTASLMHSLQDLTVLRESYRNIYANYRSSFGTVEFLLLKAQARVARLTRKRAAAPR
jgi:glycosyltransferase involved in cell wall biosynthesis